MFLQQGGIINPIFIVRLSYSCRVETRWERGRDSAGSSFKWEMMVAPWLWRTRDGDESKAQRFEKQTSCRPRWWTRNDGGNQWKSWNWTLETLEVLNGWGCHLPHQENLKRTSFGRNRLRSTLDIWIWRCLWDTFMEMPSSCMNLMFGIWVIRGWTYNFRSYHLSFGGDPLCPAVNSSPKWPQMGCLIFYPHISFWPMLMS